MSESRFCGRATAAAAAVLLCLLAATAAASVQDSHLPPGLEFHVSPDGTITAAGTPSDPLSLDAAVPHIRRRLAGIGVPTGGVLVHLHGGRYPRRTAVQLGPAFTGRPDAPIVFEAVGAEPVVLDGGADIPWDAFAPVTGADERGRLAAAGRDRVVAATVADDFVHAALAGAGTHRLTINGVPYAPATFPNDGWAHLDPAAVEDEACPPGIPLDQQRYGVRAGTHPFVEPGREPGWRGSRAEPRGAWASFRRREADMAGTWEQWAAELARRPASITLTGYIEANWLLSSHELVAADPVRRAVHLPRALSYGWGWRKDKPFRITGLLCELDAPGEWHYDAAARRIYLIPPAPLTEDAVIAIPAADGGITLDGTAHVTIRGVHVRNLGRGAGFLLRRGHDNLISGGSVQGSPATGVQLEGRDDAVVGLDLIDLDRHVRLGGGRRGPERIESGGNLVENCHITQSRFRHRRVSVGIGGVGNRFRHNLVHNSMGQAITVSGNDHLIEGNELFNIGFEEGDGGAIYAGADLTAYGVVYRHNFIHHLMHVPGKVARSGIHLDDLQAGSSCIGNVFYKSAEKGIFMNAGAGHRILGNVFVAGAFGALNRASGSEKNWRRNTEIRSTPDHPHRLSKEDYLGRAERTLGPAGWTREPWASRYPRMAAILSDEGRFGRLWPIGCDIEGNIYAANTRANRTFWDRFPAEATAKSTFGPEFEVGLDVFRDVASLDFRPAAAVAGTEAGARLAAIPFDSIGLRLDEHRSAMPDRTHYRRAIRAFHDGVGSMPGTRKQIDTAAIMAGGPVIRRPAVAVAEDVAYDFNYARRGERTATIWYGADLAVAVEDATAETFDFDTMVAIVELLTRTVRVFEDITGVTDLPRNQPYAGRMVIQVPLDNAGAGGLAHHGVLGISVGRPFFDRLHDRVRRGDIAIDQVWLYEMNRNFFRPRWNDHIDWAMDGQPANWGWWTVGMNNAAAVFVTAEMGVGLEYFGRRGDAFRAMMDDDYAAYRSDPTQTFESAWMHKIMPWRAKDQQTVNDLMSGTLLHWWDRFGGTDFLRRMYREIPRTPKLRDRFDVATARDNWYRIVSRAAGEDLRTYFEDELRWPISEAAAKEIAAEFRPGP